MARHGRQHRQGAAAQRGRGGRPRTGEAIGDAPSATSDTPAATALSNPRNARRGPPRGSAGAACAASRPLRAPDAGRRSAPPAPQAERSASPSPARPSRSRSPASAHAGRSASYPRDPHAPTASRPRSRARSRTRSPPDRSPGSTARHSAVRLASVAPRGPGRARIHTPRGMGWRDALVANADLMVWANQFSESHDARARFRRVLWLVRSLAVDEMDHFLGERDD